MSSTASWDNDAWLIFHKKAIDYPAHPCECAIQNIQQFYTHQFLQYIKCDKCKNEYLSTLSKIPIRSRSSTELFNWTVDIHNRINASLGKKQYSYVDAYNYWLMQSKYNNMQNNCITIYV
jgi:hypothetical protein